MSITNLLEAKNKKRLKRIKYQRSNYHRFIRLSPNWRSAKGLHSKIRENRKGNPPKVKIGYGTPSLLRHHHYSGLKIKRIENLEQLDFVEPEKDIIVIAKTVGKRNRLGLLQKAIERKISILNIKNPELYKKRLEEEFLAKIKKKAGESKKEAKKEVKKETKPEVKSDEEKRKEEKEEKDKVLTKRQV